jgi:hypothetical protein
MCPFPTSPTFCVDDSAILQFEEKFTRFVFNIDQIVDELIDLRFDVLLVD